MVLVPIYRIFCMPQQSQGDVRNVRSKQNGELLVSKVQGVLFLLHSQILQAFHCLGYKQLFTSISGWK